MVVFEKSWNMFHWVRKFCAICATNWLFWHSDSIKFNFGRGSVPDSAGEAYNVLPGPLVVVEISVKNLWKGPWKFLNFKTRSIWKMLGPFTTATRRMPIQQVSLLVLSHAACALMSTTTTTTTRDRGDRYGPMEWAQSEKKRGYSVATLSRKSISISKMTYFNKRMKKLGEKNQLA